MGLGEWHENVMHSQTSSIRLNLGIGYLSVPFFFLLPTDHQRLDYQRNVGAIWRWMGWRWWVAGWEGGRGMTGSAPMKGRSWESCSFLPNPTRWPDKLLLCLRLTGLNLSSHGPRLQIISQAIGHWLLIMVLSCPMEVSKTAWTPKLVTQVTGIHKQTHL